MECFPSFAEEPRSNPQCYKYKIKSHNFARFSQGSSAINHSRDVADFGNKNAIYALSLAAIFSPGFGSKAVTLSLYSLLSGFLPQWVSPGNKLLSTHSRLLLVDPLSLDQGFPWYSGSSLV